MTDPINPESTTPATDAPAPAEAAPETTAATTENAPEERAPHGKGDRDRKRRGPRRDRKEERDEGGIESSLVRVYRCAKVVKGGRTFSFGALVVAGDRQGNVGIGYGKANEVPQAVEKATKDARRQMIKIPLKGTTIPHIVKGRCGASSVTLVPAMPGSGVTAGKSVRPVLELAGLTDILSKAYGSTSAKNLVKATIDALRRLQSREEVERDRGVKLPAATGAQLAKA